MLNVHTILVPTDCTERSRHAVRYATELAHQFQASIRLLHIVEGESGRNNLPKEALERFWKTFFCNCPCDLVVRSGDPCSEILGYVLEEPVDLIVMNMTRQRSLGSNLNGHITENVTRYSPCPVLCVKETPNPPAN
jgi:nucleotide-binding universal stress UspA family protein